MLGGSETNTAAHTADTVDKEWLKNEHVCQNMGQLGNLSMKYSSRQSKSLEVTKSEETSMKYENSFSFGHTYQSYEMCQAWRMFL